MPVGYDKPLYVLPFDHRHSYLDGVFHWSEPLDLEQTSAVIASKQVIYQGFRTAARDLGDRAALLVDERFGAAILRDATLRGYVTAVSTEKSGQDEFDFEFGDAFAGHIETVNPTFAKVLVRYNPEGDADRNIRQATRLQRLSSYLQGTKRLFMFELLVPPEPHQMKEAGTEAYDREMRPRLATRAIHELQQRGVEPDVWKIEGFERREDCENVVTTARRDGRSHVGCIVLGRGSDETQVLRWLTTAAGVRGFTGFAIGRTTWWDAIVAWRQNVVSSQDAAAQIAAKFHGWADAFETVAAQRIVDGA